MESIIDILQATVDWSETDEHDVKKILDTYINESNKAEFLKELEKPGNFNKFQQKVIKEYL